MFLILIQEKLGSKHQHAGCPNKLHRKIERDPSIYSLFWQSLVLCLGTILRIYETSLQCAETPARVQSNSVQMVTTF
jgi:hypothetical protein